jgi:hypothetical protein
MAITNDDLIEAALELASIAGCVANVCDHVEHNESADPIEVRVAGQRLRAVAGRLAEQAGESLTSLYRDRLGAIEARNVLHHDGSPDGPSLVFDGASARELQLVQMEHDRYYHPDVMGLTKADQLRHYALHLAKLAAAAADTARGLVAADDFVVRRVPDMLLFGLKLATVTGEKLPAERLDAHSGLPSLTPAKLRR